jgi:hypothetical protein
LRWTIDSELSIGLSVRWEINTMLRICLAVFLLGASLVSAVAPPVKPPGPKVFQGRISDVRGILGTLTLISGAGKDARELKFKISGARIVGLAGAEWKIGDLQEGDKVQVKLTPDGKLVQEVRVVKGR